MSEKAVIRLTISEEVLKVVEETISEHGFIIVMRRHEFIDYFDAFYFHALNPKTLVGLYFGLLIGFQAPNITTVDITLYDPLSARFTMHEGVLWAEVDATSEMSSYVSLEILKHKDEITDMVLRAIREWKVYLTKVSFARFDEALVRATLLVPSLDYDGRFVPVLLKGLIPATR